MPVKKCPPGCDCKKHQNGSFPCPLNCTCGLHTKPGSPCAPGCTCRRHVQTEEHRRKNSKSNKGRRVSPETIAKTKETKAARGLHPNIWIDSRTDHPYYHRWRSMIQRCCNPAHPVFHHYGGRGITVCEEWLKDPFAYYAHLEALGDCPPGYSIDRINNDGNYEPGNVRWASASEQAYNRRPKHRLK